MDIRRQVGINVQRLRKGRNWSQEDLALESGLHRTYISGIERGARNPTVLVLMELSDALEVSPDRLLKENPPPK